MANATAHSQRAGPSHSGSEPATAAAGLGQRIAVLVNDLGAINRDADLVHSRGAETIALSNGCVCCSIGDDLGQALLQLLAAEPPFGAVVVEASGVGDPWRSAQYALAEPGLQLHAAMVLVDAQALAAQRSDPRLADSLSRPLAHADLVLLNKADLASTAELADAQDWLQADARARGARPVPCLHTSQAMLPPVRLTDTLHQPHGGALSASPARHAQRFEAWQAEPDARFDAARLGAWLRELPAGVLRLKGRLPLATSDADPAWVDLQFAGRHANLRRFPSMAAAQALRPAPPPYRPAVVAIGLTGALPTEALAAGLLVCAVPAAHPAHPPAHPSAHPSAPPSAQSSAQSSESLPTGADTP